MKTIKSKKIIIITLFAIGLAITSRAQTFTGPTSECPNIVAGTLYTYADDVMYSTINWIPSGGASIVSGSGLSRYVKFTADGSITVQLKNSGGLLVSTGTKNVTTYKVGTISGPSSVCAGSSVTITGSGEYGSSFAWAYATNPFIKYNAVPGAGTGPTLVHTPTVTTRYRRSVAGCADDSNYIEVTRSPVTVPGTLSITSADQFCSSGVATFSIAGQTGTIKDWYVHYSDGGGPWSPLVSYSSSSSTTNSYPVSANSTQVRTYEFYSTVKSGICSAQNTTTVTVTVYPSTNAGTVSPTLREHYTNSNSGTITLGGGPWVVLCSGNKIRAACGCLFPTQRSLRTIRTFRRVRCTGQL